MAALRWGSQDDLKQLQKEPYGLLWPLLMIDFCDTKNLGVPKWDPDFGNYPYLARVGFWDSGFGVQVIVVLGGLGLGRWHSGCVLAARLCDFCKTFGKPRP